MKGDEVSGTGERRCEERGTGDIRSGDVRRDGRRKYWCREDEWRWVRRGGILWL